jgi:O-antigen ligase
MQYLVIFLLFFLQFVVLPFGASHFETPKVVLAEIGIIFLLVIRSGAIIPFLSGDLRRRVWFDNKILILALCFLSLFHLIFTYHTNTFIGNQFRMQGVFLLWMLLIFSLLTSFMKRFHLPIWTIIPMLTIQLIASIFISMTTDGRAIGTLGEPNALAASVIFIWPWIFSKKEGAKYFVALQILITISMSVLIIIFSGSRSGFLALCIQIFFLIVHRFLSFKKATIISLLMMVCLISLPLMDKETVYENRGEIWKTAVIAGYEHPIAGWGVGNIEVAFKEYNIKLYNRLQGYYVDSSHNFFLDWWIQGGVIGVGLMAVLLMETIKSFIKTKKILHMSLLLGLCMVMLFNPVSVVTLIQFWWLIGEGFVSNKQG